MNVPIGPLAMAAITAAAWAAVGVLHLIDRLHAARWSIREAEHIIRQSAEDQP